MINKRTNERISNVTVCDQEEQIVYSRYVLAALRMHPFIVSVWPLVYSPTPPASRAARGSGGGRARPLRGQLAFRLNK